MQIQLETTYDIAIKLNKANYPIIYNYKLC